MKKNISYSSNEYLLDVNDLLQLSNAEEYVQSTDEVCILLGNINKNIQDKLLSGRHLLERAKKERDRYINTKIAYYDLPKIKAFFVSLIKALKRKNYVTGTGIYGTLLNDVYSKDVMRGVRNSENAYQWTNKKWAISEEERKKRYSSLYNSLKEKGYDKKNPILILLNRSFGVKDQMLQGHHRMFICDELGVQEISVRFWSSPKAPNFMKIFNSIASIFKRTKK